MTVEDLIDELQRIPNKRVPVRARVEWQADCCLGGIADEDCENEHEGAGSHRTGRQTHVGATSHEGERPC